MQLIDKAENSIPQHQLDIAEGIASFVRENDQPYRIHYKIIDDDGEEIVARTRGDICCGGAKYSNPGAYAFLIGITVRKNSRDLDFFKWLVERSMWRDVFKCPELPAPDAKGNIFLTVYTDTACVYLMQAIIALRTPREAPSHITTMYDLVDNHGYAEGTAFLAGMVTCPHDSKGVSLAPCYRAGQHSPIDGRTISKAGVKCLVEDSIPKGVAELRTFREQPNWFSCGGVHNFLKGKTPFFKPSFAEGVGKVLERKGSFSTTSYRLFSKGDFNTAILAGI